MLNFVRRLCNLRSLRKPFSFIGFVLFGAVAFVTTVTLKHLVDTPQPLESALPGEARLYRWRSQHIFYKEMGAPQLPPMVLLHNPGLGASAYEMRHIMAKLAARYHVYAPDLPGFGLSDRPHSDYTVATYTTFCRDFLTEIVQRPAVLLASGLSCAYAVDVAQRFPALCERLILISPVSLSGTIQVPRVLLPLLRVSTFGLVAYAVCSTRAALRLLLASRAPQTQGKQTKEARAELDYLYAATHRFGAEHAPLALWRGQLSQKQEAISQFEELRQPTLVIWGAQALQHTRFNASEHLISRNSQLAIMRDAGVYVHEQYPDVVITDIVDWDDSWDNTWNNGLESAAPVTELELEPEQSERAEIQAQPVLQEAQEIIVVVETQESQELPEAQTLEHEPETPQETSMPVVEAYCVKCKRKTAMRDIQAVTMKNGRPALKGVCEVCGTGLFRIGSTGKEWQ